MAVSMKKSNILQWQEVLSEKENPPEPKSWVILFNGKK